MQTKSIKCSCNHWPGEKEKDAGSSVDDFAEHSGDESEEFRIHKPRKEQVETPPVQFEEKAEEKKEKERPKEIPPLESTNPTKKEEKESPKETPPVAPANKVAPAASNPAGSEQEQRYDNDTVEQLLKPYILPESPPMPQWLINILAKKALQDTKDDLARFAAERAAERAEGSLGTAVKETGCFFFLLVCFEPSN